MTQDKEIKKQYEQDICKTRFDNKYFKVKDILKFLRDEFPEGFKAVDGRRAIEKNFGPIVGTSEGYLFKNWAQKGLLKRELIYNSPGDRRGRQYFYYVLPLASEKNGKESDEQ